MQNIITSKYVSYFLTEVTEWKTKLSTADQVITLWLEVQRTWFHLESIFTGSEDLRAQLPEDSARFDTINSSFRVRHFIYVYIHFIAITPLKSTQN